MDQLSVNEVLAMWEGRHGELSAEHRSQFLLRKEAIALSKLPRDVIEEALRGRKRLKSILQWARYLEESRTQPAHLPPSRSDGSSRRGSLSRRDRPRRPWKLICLSCTHVFVAAYDDCTNCHQCSSGDYLKPVCRSCNRVGHVLVDGRCEICWEIRAVATAAAGRGAHGTPGGATRGADRRKRRWTGQLLDGPDEDA